MLIFSPAKTNRNNFKLCNDESRKNNFKSRLSLCLFFSSSNQTLVEWDFVVVVLNIIVFNASFPRLQTCAYTHQVFAQVFIRFQREFHTFSIVKPLPLCLVYGRAIKFLFLAASWAAN